MEIVFFIVGAIFAALGALIIWDFRNFKKNANPAKGQVVGYAVRQFRSRKSGTTETYAPVVQYEFNGQQHQFTASVASSHISHQIGDPIAILVHATDTSKARLNSATSLWIGVVLCLLGCIAMTVFFAIFRFDAFSLSIAAVIIAMLAYKTIAFLRKNQIYSLDDIKQKIEQAKRTGITTKTTREENIISDPDAFKRHVRRRQSAPAWMMAIFFTLGLAVCAGGVYLGIERVTFIETASTGYGTVVDFNSKTSTSDGRTTTTYYPVVEYKPSAHSQSVTFEHDTGSSHPGYRRGDKVKVLYLSNNPSEAIIDEGWMNYLGPLVMCFLGLVFALVGGLQLMKTRSQKAEQEPLKLDF